MKEDPIKVGDVVEVADIRYRSGLYKIGRVVAINGEYCKVYVIDRRRWKGQAWTGELSKVRRSYADYATPNP